MMKKGIYVHIPFCASKCPYCDFYSSVADEEKKDRYLTALLKEISFYENITADTIYLGGGTPSVFGKKRLCTLINKLKEQFNFTEGEITVEINPSSCNAELAHALFEAGVNRISMGLQSFVEEERHILGRNSDPEKVKEAVELCKESGIENISLDIMLGVPNQTQKSLEKTLEFVTSAEIKHISAYILKIEENTPFYKNQSSLNLPDEDTVCDFYEFVISYLEEKGFMQYEISNFAKPHFESRHNLKYWRCEEYLGLGTSAHSFLNGKRFYHERNFDGYIKNPTAVMQDGEGGSLEEYAMLKLRLTEGMSNAETKKRFSRPIPKEMTEKSEKFIKSKLMSFDGETLKFTKKGFLLSNSILAEIL